jgi:predicted PurR-regulated permease PerM|tara:strand:- start:1543 stop:1824 length:282 start_codon:yes stop_codon:yes gene_type:complete
MIITIILLALALIGSIFVIYNLLDKFEQSEEYIENLESWVNRFAKSINGMQSRMSEIDKKGTFESDDEVGYFFKELKTIMEQLNTLGKDDDTK